MPVEERIKHIDRTYKVYDCFLYNGEIAVLEIRLHELAGVIHRFVIVESDTTFNGIPKALSFDPLDVRITQFASKIRYVPVKDMPQTDDPQRRRSWQRNAILRGIPDAAADSVVLVSDVDEIPSAAIVRDIVQDDESRVFGLQLASYSFFVDYRNIAGGASPNIATVATRREEFENITPHDLRQDVRAGRFPARILANAGWQFSSLVDDAGTPRHAGRFVSVKWSPPIKSENQSYRNCAVQQEIADLRELPSWLQANHQALSRIFYLRTTIRRLACRLVPKFTRSFSGSFVCANTPPVIICPYVYAHEAAKITAKFGLDSPHGRKLEFFLWQDTNRIGGERAFQHCWDHFPDRDVILMHADMAPMPDDLSNRWYDALLRYRARLSCAGMLACNLFYPRATPDEPLSVQCAGGTFREGRIDHLHGVVQEHMDATKDTVAAGVLRKIRAVDWVTFGGVLIRREVIRACGVLDGRYRWAYVLDVDYCFEARLRGFRLFQVPIALQHEEGRTTRALRETGLQLNELVLYNRETFCEKWRSFSAVLSGEYRRVPEIRVGEEVLFRRGERGSDFLVGGWSYPEDWGVWSHGSVAKLCFQLTPRPTAKVILRIRLNAFVPAPNSVREVDVTFADKLIERWRFDSENSSGERRLLVDRFMIGEDNRPEISFNILNPRSPAQFGLSADTRKLGIGLVSLTVDPEN